MIHMTNTHIVPYMVWNDSNLDLEWFYGPEQQQSKYSHELLRTGIAGRQSAHPAGAGDDRQHQDAGGIGDRRAHAVRDDDGPRDQDAPQARTETDDRALRLRYGMDDCQVFNYWDEAYPVKTSNAADVKSLLLRRNGKLMMVVCTWNRQPERVTFDFDAAALGLSPSRAAEADRKDAPAIAVSNAKVTLDLARTMCVCSDRVAAVVAKKGVEPRQHRSLRPARQQRKFFRQ